MYFAFAFSSGIESRKHRSQFGKHRVFPTKITPPLPRVKHQYVTPVSIIREFDEARSAANYSAAGVRNLRVCERKRKWEWKRVILFRVGRRSN